MPPAPPADIDASDQRHMGRALALARYAGQRGEVPVGAVIVSQGRVIGEGFNLRETLQDPCAHAEIVALRQASRASGFWRLEGTTIYVTLEPCPMCAGALVNSRVRRLVYGCTDPKAGAVESLFQIVTDERLNHRLQVRPGVRAEEAVALLQGFFAARRRGERSR